MALRSTFDQFRSGETAAALEALVGADELTVVLGAGSSMESGLPSWAHLVVDLLRDGARKNGLTPTEADEFVDWTLQLDDFPRAGGVALELLGDGFVEALHRRLYATSRNPLPGQSAKAVAAMVVSNHGRSASPRLVTTNYDLLLKAALEEAVDGVDGMDTYVETFDDDTTAPPGCIAVRHLHGTVAPSGESTGSIVLSDRDYDTMQDGSSWQEQFMSRCLADSTCLFVGSSLTDPNLVRWLHRSSETDGATHRAVFTRQQDSRLYEDSRPKVVELREIAQRSKWASARVESLNFDYYSQAAQFLWEVVDLQTSGDNYRNLPDRLAGWRDRIRAEMLPRSTRRFAARQDELREVLAVLVSDLRSELAEHGVRPIGDEKIQASLWMLDPKTNSLMNIGSSDRAWRERGTLRPERIRWSSDFIATQAFCTGSVVERSTTQYAATRWNHVVGFPLYVHAASSRLPVGAVTLGSTQARAKSSFMRGSHILPQAIRDMSEAAVALLTPAVATDLS